MTYVAKEITKIPQATARSFGLNPADYPDTHHEAAVWLIGHVKPETNPLTTEATLEPLALQNEEVENPGDESNGETGEATDGGTLAEGLDTANLGDSEDAELPAGEPSGGELDLGASGDFSERVFDADFTEGEDLGSELLDVELELSVPELPAPDPEDFAPDDFAPEPEAPQDRFIGLDDLDRVRSLRIGDVATEALRLTTLIEHAVAEQEGEFSNIQAYVVSNLDKHTGAFTPQDDASRTTYGRFLELSSARSKIAMIDARRKDATAFLIAAGRDEVVGFDVMAAFL